MWYQITLKIKNQNTKQNYALAVCKQKHASNAEGQGQYTLSFFSQSIPKGTLSKHACFIHRSLKTGPTSLPSPNQVFPSLQTKSTPQTFLICHAAAIIFMRGSRRGGGQGVRPLQTLNFFKIHNKTTKLCLGTPPLRQTQITVPHPPWKKNLDSRMIYYQWSWGVLCHGHWSMNLRTWPLTLWGWIAPN